MSPIDKVRLSRAFTLTELIIVLVIISIIAAFAVPTFTGSFTKNREREVLKNLQLLHGAIRVYGVQNGEYYPDEGEAVGLDDLNTNLGLSIEEGTATYTCDGDEYSCSGTDTDLDTIRVFFSSTYGQTGNPCCVGGGCLLVSDAC